MLPVYCATPQKRLMQTMRRTKGFSSTRPKLAGARRTGSVIQIWRLIIMNATKLIIAAGFAIATTGAFAETGVTTYQGEHVANVYGRASASKAIADSGSDKADTKVAVKAGQETIEFGRS
jgi:hypothetical protein